MKISLLMLTCIFSCYINAQQPIHDSHPLIGQLNGPVTRLKVITHLTDPYYPARTDTLFYTLNSSRDTARLEKNFSSIEYDLHIYNKEKYLVKRVRFNHGKSSEDVFNPGKHKLKEIRTEKKVFPEYIRTDTSKSYYDKTGRLLKLIESNNRTKSRFTTIYNYDLHGNLTEERFYTFSPEISPREEMTKHMRVTYTYDEKKNWITKYLSYLSVTDGKPYQEIVSYREITYHQKAL